jgi:outer membrane protein assembly factor BamB
MGVPRFTPAAAGTKLFLLEGLSLVSTLDERQRLPAKLIAIDLAAERKLLWEHVPKPPVWPDSFLLAGPPAVTDPYVFVALRRREAGREETHVAALDARDGRLLWRQFIGAAEPAIEAASMELTHLVLTVHQDVVYCNTNHGLVAALESRTGRVRWITSYPRTALEDPTPDRNKLHLFRDLNPCLVHQDVVVVGPSDCNRLFALDATTGIPLWVTPAEQAADAIHLLGVSDNRLTVSGECVYWFDIRSGQLMGRYPEPFKAAAGFARPWPRGYGRGVIAGQHVYWPTRDAIVVLGEGSARQAGEWRPTVLRTIDLAQLGASGGNLAWANDTLLVASPDRLLAFDAKKVHHKIESFNPQPGNPGEPQWR